VSEGVPRFCVMARVLEHVQMWCVVLPLIHRQQQWQLCQ
jgi:hypothetical protein